MLYNTAVVCCVVVLCEAISLSVEAKDLMQLVRKNNGVVENVTSLVDDDRHPYKANKRLRRSTWTEFVNAIAKTVDAFHAKPLLAVATNDVENLGKQFKKKFGDGPKSIGMMLRKGVGKDGKITTKKGVKKTKKVVSGKSTKKAKQTVSKKSRIKIKDVLSENAAKKIKVHDSREDVMLTNKKLDEDIDENNKSDISVSHKQLFLKKATDEIDDLERKQKDAALDDTLLVDKLLEEDRKLTERYFSLDKSNRVLSQVHDILEWLPNLKPTMEIGIAKIQRQREDIQIRVVKLYHKLKNKLKDKEISKINSRLSKVRRKNIRWLNKFGVGVDLNLGEPKNHIPTKEDTMQVLADEFYNNIADDLEKD